MHKRNHHDSKHICASAVPIFSALKLEELQKINNLIRKKEYKKGQLLFMQDDLINHLYIVRSGRIKLYKMSQDGQQQILHFLEPGDFFGELSLFKDERYSLNAEALMDTKLCLLYRDDFENLCRENPKLSLSIIHALSKRLSYAENFIGDLTLKNTEERVASWLMMLVEKEGTVTPQGIQVQIKLSRQEIANLLGTTIETISRKLTKLQSKGIITISSPKNIIILDKERLAILATD